jgi:uncharacterized membrane protein
MIVCYIAATIVSQFVAENEEAFYAIIIFLGTAYTLIMALIGIMRLLKRLGDYDERAHQAVHEYVDPDNPGNEHDEPMPFMVL